MASAFAPDLSQAGLPTRKKNGKRAADASRPPHGLGISEFTAHDLGYNSSSTDQSPERSAEQGPNTKKDKVFRKMSQTVSDLKAQFDEYAALETSPVLKQGGSSRTSPEPDQSVKDPVEDTQKESPTIAQLQKHAVSSIPFTFSSSSTPVN